MGKCGLGPAELFLTRGDDAQTLSCERLGGIEESRQLRDLVIPRLQLLLPGTSRRLSCGEDRLESLNIACRLLGDAFGGGCIRLCDCRVRTGKRLLERGDRLCSGDCQILSRLQTKRDRSHTTFAHVELSV